MDDIFYQQHRLFEPQLRFLIQDYVCPVLPGTVSNEDGLFVPVLLKKGVGYELQNYYADFDSNSDQILKKLKNYFKIFTNKRTTPNSYRDTFNYFLNEDNQILNELFNFFYIFYESDFSEQSLEDYILFLKNNAQHISKEEEKYILNFSRNVIYPINDYSEHGPHSYKVHLAEAIGRMNEDGLRQNGLEEYYIIMNEEINPTWGTNFN